MRQHFKNASRTGLDSSGGRFLAERTKEMTVDAVGTRRPGIVSAQRDLRRAYFTPWVSFEMSGAIRMSTTPAPTSVQKPKV